MSIKKSVIMAALSIGVAMTAFGGGPAQASVLTFYGFDASAVGGPHPNSDAARASFLSQLTPSSVGVEDFEGQATGSFLGGSRALTFPPTALSGTLQSLATISAEITDTFFPGAAGPSSGSQYLLIATGGNSSYFELTLASPRTAFGFYGSSFSNYSPFTGYPPIRLSLDGGAPIDVLNVDPSTILDGSVNFFGLVSDTPFTTIRLINPNGAGRDGVGIDDFMIGERLRSIPEPAIGLLIAVSLAAVGSVSARRGRRDHVA